MSPSRHFAGLAAKLPFNGNPARSNLYSRHIRKNGESGPRENAVDIACFFAYFASSHLNLALDLEQGLTPPALRALTSGGLEALNRTGFVADKPTAFVSTQ